MEQKIDRKNKAFFYLHFLPALGLLAPQLEDLLLLPVEPDHVRVGGGLQLLDLVLQVLDRPVELADLAAIFLQDVRRLGVLHQQQDYHALLLERLSRKQVVSGSSPGGCNPNLHPLNCSSL